MHFGIFTKSLHRKSQVTFFRRGVRLFKRAQMPKQCIKRRSRKNPAFTKRLFGENSLRISCIQSWIITSILLLANCAMMPKQWQQIHEARLQLAEASPDRGKGGALYLWELSSGEAYKRSSLMAGEEMCSQENTTSTIGFFKPRSPEHVFGRKWLECPE